MTSTSSGAFNSGFQSGANTQPAQKSQASTVRSTLKTTSHLKFNEAEPHTFREPYLQRTEILRSAWTPQEERKKSLNEQLYLERRALINHWYDLWSPEQRMRFIKQFLTKCMKSELQFIQTWFIEAVPLARVDMTRVLPRHLSLKIMSYLDPRTLCRCAQVSWHWRFLADQDILWRQKCERNGWYLPYTPADNEIAAFKRYYVACWYSLDNTTGEHARAASLLGESQLYGSVGEGTTTLMKTERQLTERFKAQPPEENGDEITPLEARISSRALQIADILEVADENLPDRLKSKPPWKNPTGKPHDLELGFRALCTADADTLVEWRARSMSRSSAALADRLREAKRKRLARSLQSVRAALKQGGSISAREEKQRTLTGYGLSAMIRETTDADFESIDKSGLFNPEELRFTELINAPARTLSLTSRSDSDANPSRVAWSTNGSLWQTAQAAVASATSLYSTSNGAIAANAGMQQPAVGPIVTTILASDVPKDAEIDYRLILISTKLPAYELLIYALKNRSRPNFVPDWSLNHLIGADGGITPYCFLTKHDNANVNGNAKPRFEQLDVIVYDYYATDFTTLIGRMEQYCGIHEDDVLRERQTSVGQRKSSRKAKSVGLFCTWKTVQPQDSSELVDPKKAEHVAEILPGVELCASSADHPDCMRLFNTLALILENERSASGVQPSPFSLNIPQTRFDLFTPIAAFTDGLKLLEHLRHVFRIRISSPISVNIDQSSYSYLRHDWIELDTRTSSTNLIEPPFTDYFHADLFLFWVRTASLLDDISKRIRSQFSWRVDTINRVLCERLIGEALFKMLPVNRINGVLQPITDALMQLGNGNRQLKGNQSPLGFVIEQLRRTNNSVVRKRNVATIAKFSDHSSPSRLKRSQKVVIDEETVSESARSDTSQHSTSASLIASIGNNVLDAQPDFDDLATTTTKQSPNRKTVDFANDGVTLSSFAMLEKRKLIAMQILHTEKRLAALLGCIDTELRAPLLHMMNGNRAILGAHTMDMIFSDLLFFANLSRQFIEHLETRINEWTPSTASTIQVGPVYLQTIGTQMKLFANYIQNYPTILKTLDRVVETNSLFHAFLKKHEMTIGMNMMKLHEFYLLPLTRLYEHEKLLMYLMQHTPDEYLDMQTLKRALEKIQELISFMHEHKRAQRMDVEDQVKEMEKQIVGCPSLSIIADKSLRGRLKRFFMTRFDMTRLKLPPILTGDYDEPKFVAPEYRIYQYHDDATLFMFNDCAIMTHRRYIREPYDRLQNCVYDYEVLIKLTEIELVDIFDTKYVQNALVIVANSDGKEWICQFQALEEKLQFVTQFDKAKRLLIKFQNAASLSEPNL